MLERSTLEWTLVEASIVRGCLVIAASNVADVAVGVSSRGKTSSTHVLAVEAVVYGGVAFGNRPKILAQHVLIGLSP